MAYNFSNVNNTAQLNNIVRFIHYYAKVKEDNLSMVNENLIAQKVENDHGVLEADKLLKLAKEINNGIMPKREDIQKIISEFQAYIKQKMQDEEDEVNKADAEYKTAETVQEEGEYAADQLGEMHRQRRNTRIKQGVLGAVLGFGACTLLGPVLAPFLGLASLSTGATLLVSAGVSGYFAKFRADRSIKEAGLNDSTVIKELQKKVREAAKQYTDFKAKESAKNAAESLRNTTKMAFQNYEQIGSNYEVLQENERNDAQTRLVQLQNEINNVSKNPAMEGLLASGGKGVADYVEDKAKATSASNEITTLIQQLQNLPLDNNFQKEMARLVAEAEKKKTDIDAINIPNKDYANAVDSAIKALNDEYTSIDDLVKGLSGELNNNGDITKQFTVCENIYNPITSSLDREKVDEIESKLNTFKTEGAKLKEAVRTAWITEQKPQESEYKMAVKDAQKWNEYAKTAPADQKTNAEARAELTFMKARLLKLQQQQTGKESYDIGSVNGFVHIGVKDEITDAITKVDAKLSAGSSTQSPADALAEVTKNVNINEIARHVKTLENLAAKLTQQQQSVIEQKNKLKESLKTKREELNNKQNGITTEYKEVIELKEKADQELEELSNMKDSDIDNLNESDLNKKESEIQEKYNIVINCYNEALKKQTQIVGISKRIANIKINHQSYFNTVDSMIKSKLTNNGDSSLSSYSNLVNKIEEYLKNPKNVKITELDDYCTKLQEAAEAYKQAVENIKNEKNQTAEAEEAGETPAGESGDSKQGNVNEGKATDSDVTPEAEEKKEPPVSESGNSKQGNVNKGEATAINPQGNPNENNAGMPGEKKSITDKFNELHTEESSDRNPQEKDNGGKNGQGRPGKENTGRRIVIAPGPIPKVAKNIANRVKNTAKRVDEILKGKSGSENSNTNTQTTEVGSGNANFENGGGDKISINGTQIQYIRDFCAKYPEQADKVKKLVSNSGEGSDKTRLDVIIRAIEKWKNENAQTAKPEQTEEDGHEM